MQLILVCNKLRNRRRCRNRIRIRCRTSISIELWLSLGLRIRTRSMECNRITSTLTMNKLQRQLSTSILTMMMMISTSNVIRERVRGIVKTTRSTAKIRRKTKSPAWVKEDTLSKAVMTIEGEGNNHGTMKVKRRSSKRGCPTKDGSILMMTWMISSTLNMEHMNRDFKGKIKVTGTLLETMGRNDLNKAIVSN